MVVILRGETVIFRNTSSFKLQGIVCRQYLLKLLVTAYYLHILLDDFNVGRRVKAVSWKLALIMIPPKM